MEGYWPSLLWASSLNILIRVINPDGPISVRWRMIYKEVLSLLAVSPGVKSRDMIRLKSLIREEEWINRRLELDTMKALGIKGSPKLSKVLLALGASPSRVSDLLSSPANTFISRVETEDSLYCMDQGNSIHYSSCMASDSRSKLGTESSMSTQVLEDLTFFGKSLFIWHVGLPMNSPEAGENPEGFLARAKLRVMYSTDSSTVEGLYIEKPYGQVALLVQDVDRLIDWWTSYSTERGYKSNIYTSSSAFRTESYTLDPHLDVSIPSATKGYQDTLSGSLLVSGKFIRVLSPKTSLLKKAHMDTRKRVTTLYGGRLSKSYSEGLIELSQIKYNPQKGGLVIDIKNDSNPRYLKPWARSSIDYIRAFLGFKTVKVLGYTQVPARVHFKSETGEEYDFQDGALFYKGRAFVSSSHSGIKVNKDLPELGFYQADYLSSSVVNQRLGLDLVNLLGLKQTDEIGKVLGINSNPGVLFYRNKEDYVVFYGDTKYYIKETILVIEDGYLEILFDNPELGFATAVSLHS